MNKDLVQIIKKTLEIEKDITVLSIANKKIDKYNDEIIVIYIDSLRNKFSFLYQYEPSLHIPFEQYNIHLVELGFLIKSIYNNPKNFLMIDFLKLDNEYTIKDNHYNNILETIFDNLPIFLIKAFIINEINNLPNISNKIAYINSNDCNLLLNTIQFLIDNEYIDYDINFLSKYVGESITESLFAIILSDLMNFKQKIETDLQVSKISEGFIHHLDELYIDLQIIYSKF